MKQHKNKKIKVAVLGGGITGLTAAYQLSSGSNDAEDAQLYDITLYEKAPILGGLAAGFKAEGWHWPLEYAYHHLFASDSDIINFAKEVGFNDIFFVSPKTESLYKVKNNYRIFPVDSPQDFLAFPLLPITDRLRGAVILAILKFLPFFSLYEKLTAQQFITKFMGKRMWSVFFEQLFRKKFGKYSGNILASFLWARINKRTKKLGYIKGGFQTLVDYLEKINLDKGVAIRKGYEITSIRKKGKGFLVNKAYYDKIISTLPTPVFLKLARPILPNSYSKRLSTTNFLHALVLIIETRQPILKDTYWLNICEAANPLMFVGQHTNFVDKAHYGGRHLAYVGFYLERDDPLMLMPETELTTHILGAIKDFSGKTVKPTRTFIYKAPFAQPIFDKKFLKAKPDFISPIKNLFIANLDMTYPYDRGTNYAVKLGKEVVEVLKRKT